MPEGVNRKACDRCHKQKLLCNRTDGVGICDRCQRSGTTCTSSPSLRYKKSKEQHRRQQQQQQQHHQQAQKGGNSSQHGHHTMPPPPGHSHHHEAASRMQRQKSRHGLNQQLHHQLPQHDLGPPFVHAMPHMVPLDNISVPERPSIAHQLLSSSNSDSIEAPSGRRTPKRRRTASDMGVVPPEPVPAVPIVSDTREWPMPGRSRQGCLDGDGPLDLSRALPGATIATHTESMVPDLSLFDLMGPPCYFGELRQDYLTHSPAPYAMGGYLGAPADHLTTWDNATTHSLQIPDSQSLFASVIGRPDTFIQPPHIPFDQQLPTAAEPPKRPASSTSGPNATVSPPTTSAPSSSQGLLVPIYNSLASAPCIFAPQQGVRSETISDVLALSLASLAPHPYDPDTFSHRHWMTQLNDLNRQMLGMASLLREMDSEGPKNWRLSDVVEFPVEDLLRRIKHFHLVVAEAQRSDAPLQPGLSDKLGHAQTIGWFDQADESNIMLVLSIYNRVIDVVHRLFTMIIDEYKTMTHKDINKMYVRWVLPPVTVGGVDVPQFPIVRIAAILHAVLAHLSVLRITTSALDPDLLASAGAKGPDKINSSTSSLDDVVDASFGVLMRKEDELIVFLEPFAREMVEILSTIPRTQGVLRPPAKQDS